MLRRTLFGLASLPWLAPAAASAADLPGGPVVLTVSGKAVEAQRTGPVLFDLAALERLPQTSATIPTPWYTLPRKFTGPLLRDVLAAAGQRGNLVRAVALNDYRVDIPFDDIQRYDVLLARLLDDKPMAVRDRGPLFIIYPFHQHPILRTPLYFSRCAWQLKAIEVS